MQGRGRIAHFGPNGISIRDAADLAHLARALEGMGMTSEAARECIAQVGAALSQPSGSAGGAHPAPSGSSGGQHLFVAGAPGAAMLTGLRRAVAWDDIAQARQLLADGEDVNGHDGNGLTALWSAVNGQNHEIVRLLLDHGATINGMADFEGDTCMHVAALVGDATLVRMLADAGSELNPRNNLGWTPLHIAARNARIGVLDALVERGAHVNAAAAAGSTPLHLAAALPVAQALLRLGAAPKLCNAAGVAAGAAAAGGRFAAQLSAQTRICEVCGATEHARRCSDCRAVYFCSDECMRAGWREHKPSCRHTAAARQAAAPAAGQQA